MKFERYALKITYTNRDSCFVAFGCGYTTNDPTFFMLYSTLENAEKAAKKKSRSLYVEKVEVVTILCEIKE